MKMMERNEIILNNIVQHSATVCDKFLLSSAY